MANIPWRCVRDSDGDVKYAARADHVEKLEAKGYVCTLDPDADFNVLLPVDPESDDGNS